jgi:hypothetical protein
MLGPADFRLPVPEEAELLANPHHWGCACAPPQLSRNIFLREGKAAVRKKKCCEGAIGSAGVA